MTATDLGRALIGTGVRPARPAEPGNIAVLSRKLGPGFDNELEPVFTEVARIIGVVVDVQ